MGLTNFNGNVKMDKIEEILHLPVVSFPRSVGNGRGLSCFMDVDCGVLGFVYYRGKV